MTLHDGARGIGIHRNLYGSMPFACSVAPQTECDRRYPEARFGGTDRCPAVGYVGLERKELFKDMGQRYTAITRLSLNPASGLAAAGFLAF